MLLVLVRMSLISQVGVRLAMPDALASVRLTFERPDQSGGIAISGTRPNNSRNHRARMSLISQVGLRHYGAASPSTNGPELPNVPDQSIGTPRGVQVLTRPNVPDQSGGVATTSGISSPAASLCRVVRASLIIQVGLRPFACRTRLNSGSSVFECP